MLLTDVNIIRNVFSVTSERRAALSDCHNPFQKRNSMSSPKLTFSVEPVESGEVLYLPLAAETAGQSPSLKLILALTITNHEAASVHVSGITFSFPGSAKLPIAMQVPGGLDIAAGHSQFWVNGVVASNSTNEV